MQCLQANSLPRYLQNLQTSEAKKSEEQQRSRRISDNEGGSRFSFNVQGVASREDQEQSMMLDHATHSRNADLPPLPVKPPFEVRVANINFRTSDEDLFYHFGGFKNVSLLFFILHYVMT